MSDENKTQNSNRNGSGAKGGFKGGRKFGNRDGKPGGKGNGRSGGFKGGKPSWKKDGDSKGGKPAWKRDGEGKGESKGGKRFGDKPAWKKDGEKRFDHDDKRRDDRKGGKPAWKKDDKGGKRFGDNKKRFDRNDGKRRDERKDDTREVKVDFKPKREYTKVDESSYEKPNFKKSGPKPGPKKDFRSDDRPREKRGDKYLRDNARLKSKKERDAMELSREDDFVYAGDRSMPRKAMDGIFVEIGETLTHATYGEGVARRITGGKIGVEFDGKYRWFAFPSSIENGTLKQGSAEVENAEEAVEELGEVAEVEEAVEVQDADEAVSNAVAELFAVDFELDESAEEEQMELEDALAALDAVFGADEEPAEE